MSTSVTEPEQPTRTFLQRVPTPVFVTVYGALVVAAVVGAVFGLRYTADAESTEVSLPQPVRPFNPAPADPANVAASVRPHLIQNLQVGKTNTGVMARGDLAEYVMSDSTEFAGHVSRLLEQNCLDTLELTTPDGMRVNFWGFCFATIPATTIQNTFDFAVAQGADSASFAVYPAQNNFHEIRLIWTDAEATGYDAKQLERQWKQLNRPDEIDRIAFFGYYDDEVIVVDNDKKDGRSTKTFPAGEAFNEKWGLER
ncbi:hypothetical protein QP980_00110 [Corynebacterium coyleae]|uniref:hypothetical protein n=1 Tax=Corynebacterium coyleae TaxID=53374 RepID=UPI00254C5BDB|nr:hypothetical protein [Corynebacterium coyleae]MDK8822272.1 hypothetical protein [Corynebacterium coyleae]